MKTPNHKGFNFLENTPRPVLNGSVEVILGVERGGKLGNFGNWLRGILFIHDARDPPRRRGVAGAGGVLLLFRFPCEFPRR